MVFTEAHDSEKRLHHGLLDTMMGLVDNVRWCGRSDGQCQEGQGEGKGRSSFPHKTDREARHQLLTRKMERGQQ